MTQKTWIERLREVETPLYRLTFASFGLFSGLGAYVLFDPIDALVAAFGVVFLITLALGVLCGLVTIYTPDTP
jgi:hypothetical protein